MSSPVVAYIYDLSQGMAKAMGPMLGFHTDGVWHTSVVVYGTEWFFGGGGIERCLPGTTQLGPPLQRHPVGNTAVRWIEDSLSSGYGGSM